jgi:uncharacterized protein (DUF2141 family)
MVLAPKPFSTKTAKAAFISRAGVRLQADALRDVSSSRLCPQNLRYQNMCQPVLLWLVPNGTYAQCPDQFWRRWNILVPRRESKFTRLLSAINLAWEATASAADLNVESFGAEDAKREINVALFDKPELFPKAPFASQRLSAGGGKVVAIFHDVPRESYAVSAFLDKNANGGLLGLPTERYCFSREAIGRRPAPALDDAWIALGDEPQTIVITLRQGSRPYGST